MLRRGAASVMPNANPELGSNSIQYIEVQGPEIRYADSTKQFPSRARQNRQARAGTNFTKPRTSLFSELCTGCISKSCEVGKSDLISSL